MAAKKHVCGPCGKSFTSESSYLDHVCGETEHTPRDIEHQDVLTGGQFSVQASKARERGEERQEGNEVKEDE